MKLRNKKTGGIWDIPKMRHPIMQEDDISFFAYGRDEGRLFSYKSLAELNEEWEDYKEPRIEDESVRIKRYKNIVVSYDKVTGYLYIDDEETDEQLEVFCVQEEESRKGCKVADQANKS